MYIIDACCSMSPMLMFLFTLILGMLRYVPVFQCIVIFFNNEACMYMKQRKIANIPRVILILIIHQIFLIGFDWSKHVRWLKTKIVLVAKIINTTASILLKNMLIFVLGHYLFLKAQSFPWSTLLESCLPLGKCRQISDPISLPNLGGYCLHNILSWFRPSNVGSLYVPFVLLQFWKYKGCECIHSLVVHVKRGSEDQQGYWSFNLKLINPLPG